MRSRIPKEVKKEQARLARSQQVAAVGATPTENANRFEVIADAPLIPQYSFGRDAEAAANAQARLAGSKQITAVGVVPTEGSNKFQFVANAPSTPQYPFSSNAEAAAKAQAQVAANAVAAATFEQNPAAATAGNPQVVQSEINLDAPIAVPWKEQVASFIEPWKERATSFVEPWKEQAASFATGTGASLLAGGGFGAPVAGIGSMVGVEAGQRLTGRLMQNEKIAAFGQEMADTINQERQKRVAANPEIEMQWTTPEQQVGNIAKGVGGVAGFAGASLAAAGIQSSLSANQDAQALQVGAQDPNMMKAAYTQALLEQQMQQQMISSPPVLSRMDRAQIGAEFASSRNTQEIEQRKEVTRQMYQMAMEQGDRAAMEAIAQGQIPAEAIMYGGM